MGYMLVSIIWSDIPYTSFKRWIRELIAVVMAFVVLSERDPRKAVESVIRRTVYILIPFSILLIQYFPEYGRQYHRWSGELMWIGVTLQKNSLGRLCIISVIFLVWTLVRRWDRLDTPGGKVQRYVEIFLLITTLWLLKGPEGVYPATGVVALAAGLGMFLSLRWMKKAQIVLGENILTVVMVFVLCFGIFTVMVGGSSVAGITSVLGRDETLTGRTLVWTQLLPIVEGRPIVGSGFGSFWTLENRSIYDINDAHNGYLDVLLEIGSIGMVLLVIFLLSFCRKAQWKMADDFDWASLCICYLLMALIHNITETSINSFTQHLTAGLLFLSVSVAKRTSSPESAPAQKIFKERARV